jgi:hypothetical protein
MTERPSMLGWTRTGCRHHLPPLRRVRPPFTLRQAVYQMLLMDRSHFRKFTALRAQQQREPISGPCVLSVCEHTGLYLKLVDLKTLLINQSIGIGP